MRGRQPARWPAIRKITAENWGQYGLFVVAGIRSVMATPPGAAQIAGLGIPCVHATENL